MMAALKRLWHYFWFLWHAHHADRHRTDVAFHQDQKGRHMSAVHNMGLHDPFNRALLEIMERDPR